VHLNTSLVGREIAHSALSEDKKLIQKAASECRRVGASEKELTEFIATNEWLVAAFEAVSTEEKGMVTIDIPNESAARRLRQALTIWGSMATKKNDNVLTLTLETDAPEKKPVAQEMCDALSEQLQLPLVNIGTGKADAPVPAAPDPDAS
jgi:hypothetical protein